MITEDAQSAVLIQGIAGSGKTTVALHRLAWLLHEENSSLKAEEAIVVALSPILKLYIQRSLLQLDIKRVAVRTFAELAAQAVLKMLPGFVDQQSGENPRIRRPLTPCPRTLDRVKRSLALFQVLEEVAASADSAVDTRTLYLAALTNYRRILELDETKLLNRESIEETRKRTELNFKDEQLDPADDALFLRMHQILRGTTARHDGSTGSYRQMVVDEVQEFSPAELASIIGSVENLEQLTLVGDVAQKTSSGSGFPGWEKLRKHWDSSGSLSHFVSLAISHRSTEEIMNLAAAVQKIPAPEASRNGRKPIWFQTKHESRGLEKVLMWVGKARELHPAALTAVICRDKSEAKLAYSFLTPTFGASVRLWDEFSATFDEGVIVTDITQSKGLEFTNVVIWNPTSKSYPDTEQDRNALYVAITRAEENLCIATWQRPSPLLPNIHSKLVRGFELDLDDEPKP